MPDSLQIPDDHKALPIRPLDSTVDLPLFSDDTRPLALDHLNFQYPGGGGRVIRDQSMLLEPEKLHILSGKNGAGKSTLAKLLCGVL